jgi:hypothetical protein
MSEAKIEVQAASAEINQDETLKTVRNELNSLLSERRTHRNRLLRFQRTHKYFMKHLPEQAKEESEEKKKSVVRYCYQLLRTFCFTYNFINVADKEVDKFCMPTDFEVELKEVLTDEFFDKFSCAIKSSKDDFEKNLPVAVTEQVVEKLLKFISVKQTNHIDDKYEDRIKVLTEKIDVKTAERDAIQPPREKKERKEKPKRMSRNKEDSDSCSLEERLTDILLEVSRRTDSVRLTKDDFESFSEAQTQLDALMRETVSEIFRMKQRLRKRFARAAQNDRRPSR